MGPARPWGPGDGKKENTLVSPGVFGMNELAPLSMGRIGASKLKLSSPDELRWRWWRSTPMLPADSLLTRPPGMMYPDLDVSSASSIAELDN